MNKYIVYAFLLLNSGYIGATDYTALGTKYANLFSQVVIAGVVHDEKAFEDRSNQLIALAETPESISWEKLIQEESEDSEESKKRQLAQDQFMVGINQVLFDAQGNSRAKDIAIMCGLSDDQIIEFEKIFEEYIISKFLKTGPRLIGF